MARVLPRRGREEVNLPSVTKGYLETAIMLVLNSHGVSFSDRRNAREKAFRLFKDLLLVAPVLAIQTGLPVNVHGVGTFCVKKSANGRKRLRQRFSQRISDMADTFKPLSKPGSALHNFEEILGHAWVGSARDSSVLEETC